MNFTKKLDRAVQWAGEKMGAEAKTSMSDDFRMLESEMALRHEGMERLQRSMTAYVKWIGRRGEVFEDREKGLPISYLGRTMVAHGDEFEADSAFGSCLVGLGRANERLASHQERYVTDATEAWLESLDRSLAMMKEYQAARKKLENRRLAYDASITKMQKARRDDFRVEEELRACRAKYEESSDDVTRRMQDIKDAEADSIRDLTAFMDHQLDFHERCADELRRLKRSWPAGATAAAAAPSASLAGPARSRSNTAHSFSERYSERYAAEEEPEPKPARMPIRSNSHLSVAAPPEKPARPGIISRANTFQGGASLAADRAAVSSARSGLRPVHRVQTNSSTSSYGSATVVAEDGEDTASGGSGGRSGSPEWASGDRSTSPATSYDSGSLSRSTSNVASNVASRKPPPPPPARSKKPPPPPPVKRDLGY